MMMIRKASMDDIDQLANLFDLYRIFYERPSDIEGSKRFLSARMGKGESEIYVAAEETGLLTGFVQLYPVFSSTRMTRLWLLNDLYVLESYRGKGISIQLIDQAKQLVADTGACGMYLETAKSNLIGNRLYPRTDFVVDEDHNYYYWSKG
jgi:GNAT superfamily N-acetyltransferase